MSQNRRVFIPVILVTLISVLLIAYSFYTTSSAPPHDRIHPPNGSPGMHHPEGKNGFDFTLFGNIAIACGAISYWWFLFKTKLASPSKPLKKVAKRLYSIHTYTGWAALIFVVIHGGYYLITDLHNSKIFTGLATFLLLLGLALYGWLYKRVRNKFMRTAHFILGQIWLVALLIHTGGFFIFMVIVTLALWLIVRWIDLSAKKAALH